ncbi:MAG: tRNA N6-adenosine threonylcarbamoyltransferase [Calditrichaeota bacterium]|nr:tRNA N6-adenosine threonylcarbamoyltransferase [Calditrichota bacterium]
MTVLAVETSCDETAAAVVRDGRVLSSVVATQEVHALWGGVVPEVASRLHQRTLTALAAEALKRVQFEARALDGAAATIGPGLIGALLVGVSYAKGVAVALDVPFLGINHLEGHLWSAAAAGEQLPLPALALLVSGGHTELVRISGFGDYYPLGATLDDAAGEAFDKVGGLLGIPYPAGAKLAKLAEHGDNRAFPFAVARTDNPFDFSYSGLKSAALRAVRRAEEQHAENSSWKADLAASFQRCVIRQLVQRVTRALDGGEYASLTIGGGVAANHLLREQLAGLARNRGLRLLVPPVDYCTDNAAMIAWVAEHRLRRGETDPLSAEADPNLTLVPDSA